MYMLPRLKGLIYISIICFGLLSQALARNPHPIQIKRGNIYEDSTSYVYMGLVCYGGYAALNQDHKKVSKVSKSVLFESLDYSKGGVMAGLLVGGN